jgi:hypothetical protein
VDMGVFIESPELLDTSPTDAILLIPCRQRLRGKEPSRLSSFKRLKRPFKRNGNERR